MNAMLQRWCNRWKETMSKSCQEKEEIESKHSDALQGFLAKLSAIHSYVHLLVVVARRCRW